MSEPWVPQSQKGIFGNALLWVLGTLAVVLLIGVIMFGWRWATAGPKGSLQAREEILSGSNRISAYNKFFDLCAAVQTAETNLAAFYSELAATPKDDVREINRIKTNITGVTAARNENVNQYNADARKSYTIGQFRASDLPYQLPTTYTKGQVTSCIA